MKLQKKLLCKDGEMRVWVNFREEKINLKLLINTWNTLLLLFPVNASFPHGRAVPIVYQRRLFFLISVLLMEAVSPAGRGELGGARPEAGAGCESAGAQQQP